MNENTLDFDKQISELQGKINELEAFSKKT